MWKKLVREPLIHFLAFGALLFLIPALRTQAPAEPPADTAIVVSAAKQASLRDMWEAYWRRPPTEAEFEKLVDDYILEEVLCREAYALGLHEDDAVIRNRLNEQMRLIAEDVGALPEPSEEQLRAYMQAHLEDFAAEGNVTFRQIYFGPVGDTEAQRTARSALEQLNAPDSDADWEALGESFWLPGTLDTLNLKEIEQLLGESFRETAATAEPGAWVGPVDSKYGWHLVSIESRTEGTTPSFEEKRETVLRDWKENARQKRMDAFFTDLRAKYEVSVAPYEPEQEETEAETSDVE